ADDRAGHGGGVPAGAARPGAVGAAGKGAGAHETGRRRMIAGAPCVRRRPAMQRIAERPPFRPALRPEARPLDHLLDLVLPHPGLHVGLEVDERRVDLVVDDALAALLVLDRLDLALEHVAGAQLLAELRARLRTRMLLLVLPLRANLGA